MEGVVETDEHLQPGVPGQDAPANGSGALHDLAGDVDVGVAEGAELHADQTLALGIVAPGPAGGDRQVEGALGLQRPSQRCHHQVGPVGVQRVDRGVQGAHLPLQLGMQVLLVAALMGLGDDLVRWFQLLCLRGDLRQAEPKALRWRLWHAPAHLVRSGRRTILRVLDSWPDANPLVGAYRRMALLSS